MHLAEEWQHMVLAQAEHFNIFDDHHLVVRDGKERVLEHRLGIFVIAASEKLKRFVKTSSSAQQAFALGIYAEADEHLLHQLFKAGGGQGRSFDCMLHSLVPL